MDLTTGRAAVERHMAAMATFAGVDDDASLRTGYLQALNHVQQVPVPVPADGEPWLLVFEKAPTATLVAPLLTNVPSTEIAALPTDRRAEVEARLDDAIGLLVEADPGMLETARLLLGSIHLGIVEGMGAASCRNLLGALWLGPRASWTVADYACCLVHETTHQSVFLADMVSRIFALTTEEMSRPEALVQSAVRGQPRPYDLAFHSAAVALRLRTFLDSAGRPPTTVPTGADVELSVRQLDAHAGQYLTPYGCTVLAEMQAAL